MTSPNLHVDTAALLALAGQLNTLGAALTPGAASAPAGPARQPSAIAVGEVSAGVDHVDNECSTALKSFGTNLTTAASAYESTDTAGASFLHKTMPGR